MHKVKIALFNAQDPKLENNGIEMLTQKIAGINFKNENDENFYNRVEKVKVLTPAENQKILWRDKSWNFLSEEYIVVTSKVPFIIFIEERFLKVEGGETKEETNRVIKIESNELEKNDDYLWNIISTDDRKYAIVNESEIQKPVLQVISGGKK